MPSTSRGIALLRQKLIDSGVLKNEGQWYLMAQNFSFSSPSTAAAVVMGRSANGRIEWKDKSGKTLKDIQKALAEGQRF